MLCYPVCPDFRAGGTKIGAFKRGFAAAKPQQNPLEGKKILMTTCSWTRRIESVDGLVNWIIIGRGFDALHYIFLPTMLTIKRYPNRKLYDTEAKKYITLDGISQLIRDGREVQVVDHASGEDLTTVILTQIIFEQEKKNNGFLPRSVLRGLVQAGGDTVSSLRKTLSAPLEMISHVDEEIRNRVDALIKGGEMTLEDGQNMLNSLIGRSEKAEEPANEKKDELPSRLADLGVPTRQEIDSLKAQLESLEATLDKMGQAD